MKVKIFKSAKEAGAFAAKMTAETVNECISKNGSARVVFSTGASQFAFFDAIVHEHVDWSKVEMFHLDEYIGIDKTHKASFRRYLEERFVNQVMLKAAHFVDGMGVVEEKIARLTAELKKAPIDVGLIGIGENCHIAFNDPPADFDDEASFKIVRLDEACKEQQVRENWFESIETACTAAVSMTCKEIMNCKKIISLVPYAVKARAIKRTLENEKSVMIPSTLLKDHADCTILCDEESAALVADETLKKFV